jgi:hypothetical protein
MGGVLRLEVDRHFSKFFIIGILIFYLFGLTIVQFGIMKYNSQVKKHEEFVELEQKKVQRYINVKQFGWAGIRRALESTPLSAMFFNSTPLGSLVSFCDVGFRLELSKTEIGNGLFEDTHKGSLDYSWYILTIGGLFVSVWGFFAFRNKEYIRLLLDFTSLKNVRFGILMARLFLVFIFQLIFLCLTWIQFLINGIFLNPRELLSMLVFLLISTLVLFFLLVLSSALGSVKNVIVGGIVTGVIFFILIWLCPEILNVVFSRLAAGDIKSFYAHEIKKVEKLMKFEKEIYAKIGTGRYTKQQMIDIEKKAGEAWYTTEYGELEDREAEMIANTDNMIKQFQFVSIINPATFYKSVNGEISSKGFNAYRMFYKAILEGQKKFLRYYLDERWKENYKPKIEHILKDDELVLKSKSSLPYFFFAGLILILLYIVGALLLSFYRSKKFLFPDIQGKTGKLDIQLNKGEDVHIIADEDSTDLLSNVLNGEVDVDQFDGKITIDGKSIVTKDHEDLYYFPDVQELPGNLSVKSITSLAKISAESDIIRKRLKDIDFESKLRLMLKMAKSFKRKIYVFNLSVPGSYYELIRELRDEFKSFTSEESLVIYLCSIESAPLGVLNPKISKIFINVKGEFIYTNLPK